MKKIQFYVPDDLCRTYLPVMVYRSCLEEIADRKGYHHEIVHDLGQIENDPGSIVILNLLSIISNYDTVLNHLKNFQNTSVLISTEYYTHFRMSEIYIFVHQLNQKNIIIFEYNVLNIGAIRDRFPGLPFHFVPLCYSAAMDNSSAAIPFSGKDIDILFFGSNNDRRSNILNALVRYKVCRPQTNTFSEIVNYIHRSKIVLNIYYYEYNKVFDYYRNSIVLANKALLIAEKHDSFDYDVEKDLRACDEVLIQVKYDQILETIDRYMAIDAQEYDELVDRHYNVFKNYEMEKYVFF